MPEGPEVRTVCLCLYPIVNNSTLLSIDWTDSCKKHKLIQKYSQLSLPCTIIAITCRGKKIFIALDNGAFITSTLGMTGRWWLERSDRNGPKIKHSDIWLTLRRQHETFTLWYSDPRRFGNLDIWFDYQAMMAKVTKEIGPDMLAYSLGQDQGVDENEWISVVAKRPKVQVCQFLMDQSNFSGIGNYLKSEILYRARIAPQRLMESLSIDEVKRLRTVSLDTIKESFLAGGLTISTYWDPEGRRGCFQPLVYNRTHDPEGRIVVRQTFKDGRSTHWVPGYQV